MCPISSARTLPQHLTQFCPPCLMTQISHVQPCCLWTWSIAWRTYLDYGTLARCMPLSLFQSQAFSECLYWMEILWKNILHIGLHILNSSFAHVSCSLPDTVALKHTCVCVIGAGEGSWHAHKDVGGLWRWESTADPDAYRPPHQVPAGLPPLLRWRLERWSGTVPPVVCAAVRAEISTGITLAKLYLHRWAITGEILWDTGEEHVWLVLIVLFVSFGEKR